MNLLEETKKCLADNNKTPSDIEWIGSEEFGWFTWDDFVEVANQDYDEECGFQEVAKDLIIKGDNFFMDRREYDGSEWWEFHKPIKKPPQYRKPKKIMNGIWNTLSKLNKD